MARPVGESVLRALVGKAREADGSPEIMAVAAAPKWSGEPVLKTDAGPIRIVPCISPLAVRDALTHLDDRADDEVVVILTDRDERELGQEVFARLWRQRLLRPTGWEAAKDLFRADSLDPALADARWLIDLLVDVAPTRGYPPPPSGLLTIETAWRTFLRHGLRLEAETPTLEDLLRWGRTDGARAALTGPPARHLDRIVERLENEVGPAAGHVLRLVSERRGDDLVPLGLIADILWVDPGSTDPSLVTARVRFEGPLGAKKPTERVARSWGEAAAAVARKTAERDDGTLVAGWLNRAESILTDLDALDLAFVSDVLPWAFSARLIHAGRRLEAALEEPNEESLAALVDAAELVRRHLRARTEDEADRVQRLRMATRLVRRWVTAEDTGVEGDDLEARAAAYVADGAWVDAARESIGHGEMVSSLADAYGRLIESIDSERATRDRSFGSSLAAWSAVLPADVSDLLPIERVLDEVLAPVARSAPTLLLVLDGLSYPEATRLFGDLRGVGWIQQGPGGRELPPVAAALPTLTFVSRASLLSGRITEGGQDVERSGFEGHTALKEASGGSAPRLFHKKDLKTEQGRIAAEVRDAILNPAVRVVGAVVNAVDDHLDKGSQLRLAEGLRALRPLRPLLDAAAEAGRAVVIASDHGHVLEHGSSVRVFSGSGERWRPATDAPGEDEVLIEGPRVVKGDGRIVAPVVETIRYTPAEKRGYHGGATPQEVLCPLTVMTTGGVKLEGWEPLPPRQPAWWESMGRSAGETALPRVQPPEPLVEPGGQGMLFTETGEVVRASVKAEGWLGALLSSPVLEEQRAAAGRQALDDQDVATFLTVLDRAGGVAPPALLADVTDLPASRLRGKLEALRRMLNVDGYPVLTIEADGTARLNRDLLVTQFQVDQ